jgi:hypothetical protein
MVVEGSATSVDKALANLAAAVVSLGQDLRVEPGGGERGLTALPDLETSDLSCNASIESF